MASPDFPDSTDPDIEESLDQVCYVLHSAQPTSPRKTGRPPRVANADPTHANTLPPCIPDEPPLCGFWRHNAFHAVWGRLETLIQVTLEEQNDASFKEISLWVRNRQYFEAQQQLSRSARVASLGPFHADTSTYGAHIVGSFNKKLHAALLFLGGGDPSDHQNTFDGLSMHLKSQNCHVARLVASDFPSKCQVAVPLYSLLRQFLQIQPETADMEILAAWYSETRNHGQPVVIIVEHMERCCVTALSELIVLLSEWSTEIPIILILGVATTADVLQRFLPSNALSRLVPCAFTLTSPLERLESVVRAVLVGSFCAFEVSHIVFKHMHMHFLRHDLTVTSFIMSLKVACMEHFCGEPLSFVSQWLLRSSSQVDFEKHCAALPVELLEYAARLPSAERADVGLENMSKQIASRLWRIREQKQLWTVALLCLVEVGKQVGVGFLEIFGRALCPSHRPLESAEESNSMPQPTDRVLNSGYLNLVTKLREQTPLVLMSILEEWKRLTSTVSELHADVCTVHATFLSWENLNLQSTSSGRLETMASGSESPSCTNLVDISKSPLSRPSSEYFVEQTSQADLHCRSVECTPNGAEVASPQGFKTPSKSPGTVRFNESPRRSSSKLTPAKRLISESGFLDSASGAAVRPPKSPKTVGRPSVAHGSPRRPSTRNLAPDLNAAAVVKGESPRKPPKSPAKSPRKLPKSPAKSPREVAQSPAKISSEVRAAHSPRRRLLKSPEKKL